MLAASPLAHTIEFTEYFDMADQQMILENGVLRPATEEEIAEIEQRKIAADAVALQLTLDAFNRDRYALLAETDWWVIRASEPDGVPMTEEQLAYRQALRVMDDAEDFDPFNPVWPVKPA